MTRTQDPPNLTGSATLREFLLGQDTEWLVDELLRAAQADPLVVALLKAAAGW